MGCIPEAEEWVRQYPNLFGEIISSDEERTRVMLVLYTWKNIFVIDPREMPATDLVVHRIPTYPHMKPNGCKPKLYTQEERDWGPSTEQGRKGFPDREIEGMSGESYDVWQDISDPNRLAWKSDGPHITWDQFYSICPRVRVILRTHSLNIDNFMNKKIKLEA